MYMICKIQKKVLLNKISKITTLFWVFFYVVVNLIAIGKCRQIWLYDTFRVN